MLLHLFFCTFQAALASYCPWLLLNTRSYTIHKRSAVSHQLTLSWTNHPSPHFQSDPTPLSCLLHLPASPLLTKVLCKHNLYMYSSSASCSMCMAEGYGSLLLVHAHDVILVDSLTGNDSTHGIALLQSAGQLLLLALQLNLPLLKLALQALLVALQSQDACIVGIQCLCSALYCSI